MNLLDLRIGNSKKIWDRNRKIWILRKFAVMGVFLFEFCFFSPYGQNSQPSLPPSRSLICLFDRTFLSTPTILSPQFLSSTLWNSSRYRWFSLSTNGCEITRVFFVMTIGMLIGNRKKISWKTDDDIRPIMKYPRFQWMIFSRSRRRFFQ